MNVAEEAKIASAKQKVREFLSGEGLECGDPSDGRAGARFNFPVTVLAEKRSVLVSIEHACFMDYAPTILHTLKTAGLPHLIFDNADQSTIRIPEDTPWATWRTP